MLQTLGRTVRAVTFDCWNTLIAQREQPGDGGRHRADALVRSARGAGVALEPGEAGRMLDAAWRRHREWMRGGRACGSLEIARWALEDARVPADGRREAALAQDLAEAALEPTPQLEVFALEGARHTLAELAGRGLRLALICDTGYSPGRVVRRLLDQHALLEWLEVQVFSDEVGLLKPDARVFHTALRGLGASPEQTVHVGDLRETDVAGARGVGMGSIRLRDHHDDRGDLPEADAVADSHAHLREILGV